MTELRAIIGADSETMLDFAEPALGMLLFHVARRHRATSIHDIPEGGGGDEAVDAGLDEAIPMEVDAAWGEGGHCVVTDSELKAQADACSLLLKGWLSKSSSALLTASKDRNAPPFLGQMNGVRRLIQDGATTLRLVVSGLKSSVFLYL